MGQRFSAGREIRPPVGLPQKAPPRTTGGDDGIRTRDPHLGKVRHGAGPQCSLAVTCTIRYDWVRFSTARYLSFFHFFPEGTTPGARPRRIFGSTEARG